MKVKVELLPHERPEDADEFLEKALKAKHECFNNERYSDAWLNELHDYLIKTHHKLLEDLQHQIAVEISRGD